MPKPWCDEHVMGDLFALVEKLNQRVVKVSLPPDIYKYLAQFRVRMSLLDDGWFWGARMVKAEDSFVVAEGSRGALARAWRTGKGVHIESPTENFDA